MKISVILPTYNRADILNRTIKNVLNQSYSEFELIIINDASCDETLNVVKKYISKDARIKLINNYKNLGCAKSRECGLAAANYDYIVFIDDDDFWDENKLLKQINSMNINAADIVICDYYIESINQKTYKSMKGFVKNFKKQILQKPGPFFQSIMIKKELFKLINSPFDTKSIPSEDWNFFIELSKINPKFSHVNEPLFTWKLHNNNQSLDIAKEVKALINIIDKHYEYILYEQGTSIIANHYRRIARLYERLNDKENIKMYYLKAFKINPINFKNIFYYICVVIGYEKTKSLINCMRILRGVPNA